MKQLTAVNRTSVNRDTEKNNRSELTVTLIQITRIYAQVLRCSLHAMINVNLLVQKLYNDEIENIRNCGFINNSKAKEKHYFLHFVRLQICKLLFVDFRAELKSLELRMNKILI